jgi:UDP-N-acetylmuramyl tripeptide synthase
VGLALDPRLLERLLFGREVFLVSGTNGKTTTTALLRAALGVPSASNSTGANMPAGLVAALQEDRSAVAVLEVDESWLGAVVDAAKSARSLTIVLLNLSRDQLDRSSEVRQIAERWRQVFTDPARGGRAMMVANVNDPLVAYAVDGVSDLVPCNVPVAWLTDAVSCARCTRELKFSSDGSGDWWCVCGLRRPTPKVSLGAQLEIDGALYDLDVALPGEFNRSNAALAVTAATKWGADLNAALARVAQIESVAGRFGIRQFAGVPVRVMLAKNPAGARALLETISDATSDVVVSINDNVADGHDPSWLYDAPFELLSGRVVWCHGTRALDLATRLECDGVEFRLADDDARFPSSVRSDGPVDVIANYTSFSWWLEHSAP